MPYGPFVTTNPRPDRSPKATQASPEDRQGDIRNCKPERVPEPPFGTVSAWCCLSGDCRADRVDLQVLQDGWASAVMIGAGPAHVMPGCLAGVARCGAVSREAVLPAPFPGASGFALDGLPPVRVCGDRGWD